MNGGKRKMKISEGKTLFQEIKHEVDFCVVGGGMAGMLAAIAAARHGTKVLLMQDRPMLGGNASSEIRMWIRGAQAHGENLRETGILEEIALENIYRNPSLNFSIWDSVLYEKVRFEPNIELLLNCSCCELGMDGERISWVKGWQTTTQKWHKVSAKLFADCSGDSVLVPMSGAECRWGREASDEFSEDIEPAKADRKTMGLSCLIQARETNSPKKYIAPKWANKYTKDSFPYRINLNNPKAWINDNFWWVELGGTENAIDDTEKLRDELLKVSYGVWDFIKNGGYCDAENWELEWIGILPGKRESRRYVGDHILNQNDVRNEGKFDDLVAYGGWSMDDHHPGGFNYPGKPTIFHPAPAPYGIPYRSLYSKNISNLFVAGRNISATHAALSSTRVMATCAIMGQAVGTAASIAVKYGLEARGVYEKKIDELKQTLMEDDCYLPWNARKSSEITRKAVINASNGDASVIVNGIDRPVGSDYNGWIAPMGSWVEFDFGREKAIQQISLTFDSDLNRETFEKFNRNIKLFPMKCNVSLDEKQVYVPKTLIKAFRIEAADKQGNWKVIHREANNYQRFVKLNIEAFAARIRLIPEETWGCDEVRMFAIDIK